MATFRGVQGVRHSGSVLSNNAFRFSVGIRRLIRTTGQISLVIFISTAASGHLSIAQEAVSQTPPAGTQSASHSEYHPKIAEASRDAEIALNGFRLPEGMNGRLVAAEPSLANPVAFSVTPDGRIYVCETFRQEVGVEDNRSHMNWLMDDLQLESVEERMAMFRRYMGNDVSKWAVEQDRVRLLRDTDGDGRFETDSVFADGFNDPLDGTGAGVIELNGRVYYACIPNLWLLEDSNHDGIADRKEILHHGYGVRVAFRGHDLHGLTVGPEGRLYFSLGDRGYNVVTTEGNRLKRPDTGAVFRCDPDGSHLEVFAWGLRNPQELAFDDHGRLFTGDNNSDSGDQARWVYVVQDGDTGWRMHFQYLNDRGPWNRERMWYPWQADEQTKELQPASIIPPVANLGDGPSGLTWYPGTGLPDRYKDHFFMADFRGTPGNSGIRSFAVTPKGAFFELTDSHEFIWSILATDVDFAPDGSLYVSDWVNGWVGEGRGRIYRFAHEQQIGATSGSNVAALLSAGMTETGHAELLSFLSHADRRIRQQAQFELVKRKATMDLLQVAADAANPVARRHALWGLWQTGLQSSAEAREIVASLTEMTAATSEDTLIQTLKVIDDLITRHGLLELISENQRDVLRDRLATILQSQDLSAAGFAAVAMGSVGRAADTDRLLALLDRTNNTDPVLRHQASMGLYRIGKRSPGLLAAASGHPGAAGRLGLVLALRRLGDPAVATFLKDADPGVMAEAARAVNDEPIESAQEELAALADTPGLSEPVARRVLNACYRLGRVEHIRAVARFAAEPNTSDELRLVTAVMLKTWNNPQQLDTVTGRWRPLSKREVEGLGEEVQDVLPGLMAGSEKLREQAVEMAAALGIKDVVPSLERLLADQSQPDALRVSAFRALTTLSENLTDLVSRGRNDSSEAIRIVATEMLVQTNPDAAIEALEKMLNSGTVTARQAALKLLGTMKGEPAEKLLVDAGEQLLDGKLPPEVALDLIEAATSLGTSDLKSAVSRFRLRQQEVGTTTALWSECLSGGSAERGREIFFGRSAASCRRCHKVGGSGGEVGPDLSAIARDKERLYLLESIVDPGAKIAKGFETVIIVTTDGRIQSGILRREDDSVVQLMTPEGATVLISKSEIDERSSGQSGMPADIAKNLTRSEIRDLIEYLTTLKSDAAGKHGTDND